MGKDFFSIMHRFKKLSMRVKLFDVSHGEFFMLGAIYGWKAHPHWADEPVGDQQDFNCGLKISELSGMMKGSKSATSKMLRVLEEKGYIERISDPKDKRNIYVKLTDKGVTSFKNAKINMQDMSNTIMERMGDEDMQHLNQLCGKLCNILEEEINEMEVKNKKKGNM